MAGQSKRNSFRPLMAGVCVHALVFKFCVQTIAEELKIDEFPSPKDNDESKEINKVVSFFGPEDFSGVWLFFCPARYIGFGLVGYI